MQWAADHGTEGKEVVMASIYKRGNKLCIKVKRGGKWVPQPTTFVVGQEAEAMRYAKKTQELIDRQSPMLQMGPFTVREYAEQNRGTDQPSWLEKRKQEGHDWTADRGRLRNHALPIIGDLLLADVRPHHIADMVHKLRFPKDADKTIAPRTLRNIYSVVAAMFRDAAIDKRALIDNTPCILTEAQLGPVEDLDPEWRDGAVFTRDEAETLISDPRIPFDRQLAYGFGLLAGTRPGEVAALRWKHYDATREPLGRMLVATAYNAKTQTVGRTKTRAVRNVPVHPTLAAMLAEWKLSGWEAMMGRAPTDEDLILPIPSKFKKTRKGSEVRDYQYNGYQWRTHDLPMLGWRERNFYDTKATFISLAIEDGAKSEIIRDRVTHSKSKRDAFSGYDRGPHYIEACQEVAKLKLSRRSHGTGVVHVLYSSSESQGFRQVLEASKLGPVSPRGSGVSDEDSGSGSDTRGTSREGLVPRMVQRLCHAVLDGDQATARKLAEQILGTSKLRAVK